MEKKALYPGSFDPFTLGHLDIISRASAIFDEVRIGVATNNKKTNILSLEERIDLAKKSTEHLKNIDVAPIDGLVIDYAKQNDYKVLLRGIRAANDFEQELEMSQINRALSLKRHDEDLIETIFLMTSPEYSFIRASRVWELLNLGGDITSLLPKAVSSYLEDKNIGYLQETR